MTLRRNVDPVIVIARDAQQQVALNDHRWMWFRRANAPTMVLRADKSRGGCRYAHCLESDIDHLSIGVKEPPGKPVLVGDRNGCEVRLELAADAVPP